jgi:D-3-phosphoglycerate dehydrogenase
MVLQMKILITPTSLTPSKNQKALELLEREHCELVFNDLGRPLEPDEIIERLDGVDGYIAGLDYITEKVIVAAPASLKVISRYGMGCDRVDIAAATKRNIAVTNTPGANANAVADLVLGLMISVARKLPYLDKITKNGEWVRTTGVELYKKTIGIIGIGAIGKGVAKRAGGFSMEILAYDPYGDKDYMKNNGIRNVTFEFLLQNSDFITLHLPLNESTLHIIDDKALAHVKRDAILINAARGGLIDENAAYMALKSGRLGGLGLDAFEKEPPTPCPMYKMENVVITPHTGAHTAEATEYMSIMAVKNTLDVLCGRDCPYMINKK